MAKDNRIIELFGGIGEWYISYNYVKMLLDEFGPGPVHVQVSSLGGSVDQALKIKQLFENHGDITVEYIGFNASAATLLGIGANKIQIREDSFFLIHKANTWIDEWGQMNADDIETVIEDLKAKQKDLETVTLVLAKMYSDHTGIELQDIFSMMKEEKWLTGQEAIDLGFAHEMIAAVKNKKPVVTNQIAAMISANGLPKLPEIPVTEKPGIIDSLLDKFTNKNKFQMNKDFQILNQILGVEGVEEKDGRIFMTVDQINTIQSALNQKDDTITGITTERDNAVTAQQTAETALSSFTASINEIDATVNDAPDAAAKVAAINTILAARPGVSVAAPQGGASQNNAGEGEWDTINNLPHNKAADNEL